jgi:sugar phosphate isomerase/epimerase
MSTRRDFVKLTATGALATTVGLSSSSAAPKVKATDRQFTLGMAGYTFNYYRNNLDKVIEILKSTNVNQTSLKDFHLPYNSSKNQIDEIINKFKAEGIEVYGLGVIYLKTQEEVDNAFNYGKMAGAKMLIVSPSYEMLPAIEKKAKEYKLKVAIHNHGPEDKLFPDIDSIHAKIKDMDPLMGICLDIGHSFRCGHNPAEMLMKFKSRIYDMHIKDVEGQFEKAKGVVLGQGKIDLPSIVKALDKSGYTGSCSLEYEVRNEPDQAIYGIAESIGYFRGLMAAV